MIDKIRSILDKARSLIAVARRVLSYAEEAVPAAELLLDATQDGPEAAARKAQLVATIQAAIDEPGGLDFPEIAKPYETVILAGAIGMLVLLIRKGSAGFAKGSES